LWKDSFERNPDSWIAGNNLGVAYLEADAPAMAQRHYERLLKKYPPESAPDMVAGHPNYTKRRYERIADSFATSGSIRNNMGLTLFREHHVDAAIVWYRQALVLDPKDGTAHLNLANALLATEQYDESAKEFEKSIETVPATAATLQRLATALLGARRVAEAIDEYHKALKMDPDSPQLHYNLGCALAQAGRLSEAVAAFEAAVKEAPGFLVAIHNLTWVLATAADDSVRNGSRALELAQLMRRLPEGGTPMMMRAMAAAQFETGHMEEAIKTAQSALLLSVAAKDSALAGFLRSDLDGYRQGKPVRIVAGGPSPAAVGPLK
jgi:tetratricopeptide (TPR) repeat protein